MAVDHEHAASERDYYLARVGDAFGGARPDARIVRTATLDALDAARWAAGADGDDGRISSALRDAGQLGVALLQSVRGEVAGVPFRGTLASVPVGLPADGFHAGLWAETLLAATAAQDAASAVRLSRVRFDAFTPGGWPGQAEIAAAVATVWAGDGDIGSHLVAALERTDPERLPGDQANAALDLVVPQAAVLEALAGDRPIDPPLQDGANRFVRYWAARDDAAPENLLSVPLSGLAVLGELLTGAAVTGHAVIPPAVVAREGGSILACPACAEPFDPAQPECAWCDTDLTADAPLEVPLSQWLSARREPCPNCAVLVHPQALRCWSCQTRQDR
ncbi:hypothetical protein AB0L70_35880 [Kribbella sp. NPDC051952]|uniref:hypothetical protein n=1 Tax=Kribbella sp. NPDC051952 TaxID=3154851 RepID=UPI003416F752